MAKFAQVGYGSDGRGLGKSQNGYTYVVSDSVRTGEKIQPIVRHWRSGNVFATTGQVLHAYKETSIKGQQAKQQAEENSRDGQITESYTGKEVGAKGMKTTPQQQEGIGGGMQSQYTMSTRAGNLGKYMQTHPQSQMTVKSQETYDSYASKFMQKGEN